MVGELNPDLVARALGNILALPCDGLETAYEERSAAPALARIPNREQTFCPGLSPPGFLLGDA